MQPVYLDHNATTPMRPAAIAAVAEASGICGNASSVHAWGRRARARIEDSRAQLAALVGARPEQVVFTGGGTEANNLALAGLADVPVLASAVEHPSVLNAREDIATIPVDGDGILDLDALAALLGRADRPVLICVMLANNETGVIQPIHAVVELAKAHGALVHCDAVQAVGRKAVDFAGLGVDLMSVSSHKIGGPQGVGALVVADTVALRPTQRGGGQERNRRAGTENVAGIAGFGAAAQAARDELPKASDLARLRNHLEAEIRRDAPGTPIFGGAAARLANTSCIAMPGVASETQLMAFDLEGVMVSSGAACSSGKVGRSHVLTAMGVADEMADTAIRVSLGWTTTDRDIDRFIAAWRALRHRTDGKRRAA